MKIESGRILNDHIEPNKMQFCIPVFQRDYAWTKEQCEKLFEDIVLAYERDCQHFCGTFVFAPLSRKKHIVRNIIIDGQQRFTSLYILIKALADSANNEADKKSLEECLYNTDKFNRFDFEDKSKLKLKPVKTDNDQLQLLMLGKFDEINKGRDGIIYHNYMLFRQLISAFLRKDPKNSVTMIYDGIDHLICADIELDENDDAQEIFERINSTGLKLGLPDLIRNFVLMTDENQERLYEEYWLVIQDMLSKDHMEGFFLDYLNLKLEGFTKESTAYKDFKQIFHNGGYNNESMLEELLHYAKQYQTFLHGDPNLGLEINKALEGLRKLNQTTVYLFLFHLFDDYEKNVIDREELAKVLRLLLHYSIRRLVCEIGSNSLRGLYKTLYNRVFINEENKKHYYDAIVSFMLQMSSKDVIPTDADFETALKEKNLFRKYALCKYLLVSIENQGKEAIVTENLTIEHIMPQNKNLSLAWQKMLGEKWEDVRDKYLHTLGNLTLTGYNSELGDLPFPEKQKKLDDKETHVTVLYKDVKGKTEWNEKTIKARAKNLVKTIKEIFPIVQPSQKIEFKDPRYSLYTVEDPSKATFKAVNYYELLGERVNIDSFAAMVISVAGKLYDRDSSIIENLAKNLEPLPSWQKPVFSYNKQDIRNPVELRVDTGIYISTGYSAFDCICFIRDLLRKYELDCEEDFRYSARSTKVS